jgi:hypothetical protein
LQKLAEACEKCVQIQLFGAERLAARKSQQPMRQGCGALRAAHGVVQQPAQVCRRGVAQCAGDPLRAFDVADDDHQQIAEVVRNTTAELSDRLHPLAQCKLLLRLLQRALGFHPFGNVARDLGEADELAVLVANRIEQRERPESTAVATHAPAFRLVATGFRGNLQRLLRQLPFLILGREKPAERLANDVPGLVALEAFRARIPAGDLPIEIDHVDRVVDDRIDQQLQLASVAELIDLFG